MCWGHPCTLHCMCCCGPEAVTIASTGMPKKHASARVALTCSPCLQTERILKSRELFVAGAILYTALLVMWWPRGIGQLCKEVYQSCTPLPNVCSALNIQHLTCSRHLQVACCNLRRI